MVTFGVGNATTELPEIDVWRELQVVGAVGGARVPQEPQCVIGVVPAAEQNDSTVPSARAQSPCLPADRADDVAASVIALSDGHGFTVKAVAVELFGDLLGEHDGRDQHFGGQEWALFAVGDGGLRQLLQRLARSRESGGILDDGGSANTHESIIGSRFLPTGGGHAAGRT
jgi:hypothetical protein